MNSINSIASRNSKRDIKCKLLIYRTKSVPQ